ncbi:MAG: MgtC/SapB family protein [Burkholderiales bacterium]|nr:MgtC/SapB family protein [Burkholderiales bacterium]
MSLLTFESLTSAWATAEVEINVVIFLNLLGALLLGMLVGYERSYHGRAAGMRTYGLVCMASAALMAIAGYPLHWYGGNTAMIGDLGATRVIQGIVTGIGFLGAGVIMKEGFSISGLTTAASIWTSSAIGVLVGIGFYPAAILMALMSVACMMWVSRLEDWLPSRQSVAIMLRFNKDFAPREEVLRRVARERGYDFVRSTLSIKLENGQPEWNFVAVAMNKKHGVRIDELAKELAAFEGVQDFRLSHERN